MDEIRDRVSGERGGLTVKVTGAAGYGADAIKVFGNINGTLLGVTALVVLILLIIIYRSPIFWAIPFFTVLLAESSARGFGYLIAEAGVTINGQSGGILPVLVFGAGTDYALLLVSRYREELRRHEDKHDGDAGRAAHRRPGDPRLRADRDPRAADAEPGRGQRHGRPRPDRRDGRRDRDDLDAHHAARAARHLRAQGVLVAVLRHDPARRPAGHGRDPRPLAQHRRVGGGAVAARVGRRDAAARPARAQRDADRHRPDQQQLVPRRRRVRRGRRDPRALVPERARRRSPT